jgi:signal transduction histidine kinase
MRIAATLAALFRRLPRRSPSALVLFGLSSAGYLLLWIVGRDAEPAFGGESLQPVRGVACLVLFALSAAMLAARQTGTYRRLFAGHAVTSWLVLVLFKHPDEGLVILAALNLLPACLYERFPISLITSVAFSVPTLAVVLVQRSFAVAPVVAFLWVLVIIGVYGSMMSSYRESIIPLQSYINRLEDNVSSLTRANFLSQDYARDIEEESRTEERQRLTRDIHDIVGYTLTNSIMMSEAIKVMARTEPQRIPEYVEVLRQNTEEGLTEIKRILADLRSQERPRESVYWAIRKMVKVFTMSTGLDVRFEFGNASWEFFDRFGDCVYHFVQEGLINAFRHGRATRVWLFSWDYGAEVMLSVKDNGLGCDGPPRENIGIKGMRERADVFGGRVVVDDHVNGFNISLHLPRTEGGHGKDDQRADR